MKSVLIVAALIAAQFTTPATANNEGHRRDVAVNFGDLDLGTAEGVAAFETRLVRAVAKACGTAHYLEAELLNDMDRCRASAYARVVPIRDAIIRKARQKELGLTASK